MMRGARRVARTLPGLRGVAREVDALREERDRLRRDRDALRARLERRVGLDDPGVEASDVPPRLRYDLLAQPSFLAHLGAIKRHRLALDAAGRPDEQIGELSTKPGGRRLAERVGVPVAQLLASPMALPELAWPPDVEAGVIKPAKGSGGKAVFALRREGERFWSLRHQRWFSWSAVVARIERDDASGAVRGPYLLEELVPGPDPWHLPYDWKIYCIGGEPELVLQKATGWGRRPRDGFFKFWQPSFEPAGAVGLWDKLDEGLAPPHGPERLLDAARRVATAVPGPFVRVDLLEDPEHVWFGEITPHPGGPPLFTVETDRRLGAAWERALLRASSAEE